MDFFRHSLLLLVVPLKVRLLGANRSTNVCCNDQVLFPCDTLGDLLFLLVLDVLESVLLFDGASLIVLLLDLGFVSRQASFIEIFECLSSNKQLMKSEFNLVQQHQLLIRAFLAGAHLRFDDELIDGRIDLLDLFRFGAPLL